MESRIKTLCCHQQEGDTMTFEQPMIAGNRFNWIPAINHVYWPILACYQCDAVAKTYAELKMIYNTGLCEKCYDRESSYEERQREEWEDELRRERYEKHRE